MNSSLGPVGHIPHKPSGRINSLSDVAKKGEKLADLISAMLLGIRLHGKVEKSKEASQKISAVEGSCGTDVSSIEKTLSEVAANTGAFKQFKETCQITATSQKLRTARLGQLVAHKAMLEEGRNPKEESLGCAVDDFFIYLDGLKKLSEANFHDVSSEISEIADVTRKECDSLLVQAKNIQSNVFNLFASVPSADNSHEKMSEVNFDEDVVRGVPLIEPVRDEEVSSSEEEFYSCEEDEDDFFNLANLDESSKDTLVSRSVELFIAQIKKDVKNPQFLQKLAEKLFQQRQKMWNEGGANPDALREQISSEISDSPIRAVLRYGLYRIKVKEAAQKLHSNKVGYQQGIMTLARAKEDIEACHGTEILKEIDQLLPPKDENLPAMIQAILDDLVKSLGFIVTTLTERQDSFQPKGVLAKVTELARDFFSTSKIVTPEDLNHRQAMDTDSHYGDCLRLMSLFYVGDPAKNVQMGVKLLQAIRQELLKHPTKQKLQLLRDISHLYSQITNNGDALKSLKMEVNHSIYLSKIMGECLDSQPLEGSLKRLSEMISNANIILNVSRGAAKTSTPVSLISFFATGPLGPLSTMAASIYANYRTDAHLRAIDELTETQKKEILFTFMNLDEIARGLDDFYSDQFDAKLYQLLHCEYSLESWIESAKYKIDRFSLEVEYAPTSEKIVRIAVAFFSPFIFAIDTIAFVALFTALGVVTAGAVLVAGRQGLNLMQASLKSCYILSEKINDYINQDPEYKNTHERVEKELKKRRLIKFWEQQLKPSLESFINDKKVEEKTKILSGASDPKVLEHCIITEEAWSDSTDAEKQSARQKYFDEIGSPAVDHLFKNVAVSIYLERSELDPDEKEKLAAEVREAVELSLNQQAQIDAFMEDWHIYNADQTKKPEERKQEILQARTEKKVKGGANNLSLDGEKEVETLLRIKKSS